MKLLLIGASFFLIAVLLFLSCKKDKEEDQSSDNQPPLAHAGADTTITLQVCLDIINAILDGSRSMDPNNNITSYEWRALSDVRGEVLKNSSAAKANINLFAGNYAFELTVKDAGDLVAKDTVLITVRGPAPNTDLDVNLNGSYSFNDNQEDCYYGPPCSYYDATYIEATGTFPPLGELIIYFSEQSDSVASRYATESYIFLGKRNANSFINGTISVNLKKLIQQGGGSFSGTFIIMGGSIRECTHIYHNLPPLTVTGNLDTASKKTTITIKGKTYF